MIHRKCGKEVEFRTYEKYNCYFCTGCYRLIPFNEVMNEGDNYFEDTRTEDKKEIVRTSVGVTMGTKKRLKEASNIGESYEEVLNKVLDIYFEDLNRKRYKLVS